MKSATSSKSRPVFAELDPSAAAPGRHPLTKSIDAKRVERVSIGVVDTTPSRWAAVANIEGLALPARIDVAIVQRVYVDEALAAAKYADILAVVVVDVEPALSAIS